VLYLGIGGEKSPAAAFNWLKAKDEEAASSGVILGSVKYNLAMLYMRGEGTAKNEDEARRLLRQVLSASGTVSDSMRRNATTLLQSRPGKPL
jgi:TPR repeat protein